ncbi:MAG: hypothetical protein IJ618_10380 [Prevotella sp.]|nr:hypothetical protein [Prevotella sp.]
MSTGRELYMVMEWDIQKDVYHELRLFRSEGLALRWMRLQEENEHHDVVFDERERRYYYFLSTMSEEMVVKMKRDRYERKVAETREYFMSQYNGEFLPVVKNLLRSLACTLVACTSEELKQLERNWGMLHSCKVNYMPGVDMWLDVKFMGGVYLSGVVQEERSKPRASKSKEFSSWAALEHWIQIEPEEAEKVCEEMLIELSVDRYQAMLALPTE